MNWYKIRANDHIKERKKADEMMQHYSHHVQQIEQDVPKDLLQYFGTDFFHDGTIESICYTTHHNDVEMTIWGPNIKFWKRNQEYEYINCKFHVVFTNVVMFDMHVEKYDSYNDPLHYGPQTVQYLSGEINSLAKEIDEYNTMYKDDDLQFHSLIFETLPCERWYRLVFSDIRVWAEEEVAFEMMTRDPRYEIPTYTAISGEHH
jgi:hypothetical protein